MSPSPTTKASLKEHKHHKDSLAHFWGQLGGKKEWLVTNLKWSGWISYPKSQTMECWKKEFPNLVLSAIFIIVLKR